MRKKVKNLRLSKETLRSLDGSQLSNVGGGYPYSTASNCDACSDTCTQCGTINCTFTCWAC